MLEKLHRLATADLESWGKIWRKKNPSKGIGPCTFDTVTLVISYASSQQQI